jgi:hypothetical protein
MNLSSLLCHFSLICHLDVIVFEALQCNPEFS